MQTRLGQPVCRKCDQVFNGEGDICGRCKTNETCDSCERKDAEIARLKAQIARLQGRIFHLDGGPGE